jgi:large subunit ribosomal protein L29
MPGCAKGGNLMTVGSAELTLENLDAMPSENLQNELVKAKTEMFNLRFQRATGQLESHGRILAVRKDIARIQTFLRERQLGIRTEPGALGAVDSAADSTSQSKAGPATDSTKAKTKATAKGRAKSSQTDTAESGTAESGTADQAESPRKGTSILDRLKQTVRINPTKDSGKISTTKTSSSQSKTKFTRQKKG